MNNTLANNKIRHANFRRMKNMFTPTSWEFTVTSLCECDPVHIDRVRGYSGYKFAIRQCGACMDRDGTWDFEPLPSSRTDAWKKRYRYNTLHEAQQACLEHLRNKPEGRFTRNPR